MKTKFISKWREHRLVITPAYKQIVGPSSVLVPGKSIQFSNNEFETDNQEEIDFLRNHREFGKIIHEAPSAEATNEAVLKLAAEIAQKNKVQFAGEDAPQVESFACETCGFVAKSKLGLTAHSKKHEGQKTA